MFLVHFQDNQTIWWCSLWPSTAKIFFYLGIERGLLSNQLLNIKGLNLKGKVILSYVGRSIKNKHFSTKASLCQDCQVQELFFPTTLAVYHNASTVKLKTHCVFFKNKYFLQLNKKHIQRRHCNLESLFLDPGQL
jgi:hypothetical protein